MSELSIMIEKLDDAVKRFKERKVNDRHNTATVSQYYGGSNNEDLNQRDRELRMGAQKANNLKKEIARIKRQLDTAVDLKYITELEDEIKSKEMTIKKLED